MTLERLASLLGRLTWRVRARGIPRMLYALTPFIAGHDIKVLEVSEGFKLAIPLSDYASCMMLYGRYSPELVRVLKELVTRDSVVLDVGAHIGYVSSILATLVGPGGTVLSFEPDPTAYSLLSRTIEANRFNNVKAFQIGIASTSRAMSFYVSPQLGWSTPMGGSHRRGLREITIPAQSLDDFVDAHSVRRPIHLVKIDVEGGDCDVIKGMSQILRQDRPLVLTEINPDMMRPAGLQWRDMHAALVAASYLCFRVLEPAGLSLKALPDLLRVSGHELQDFGNILGVPAERPSRRATAGKRFPLSHLF